MIETINWPTEIRLRPVKRTLHLTFDNGDAFDFDAEFLRVGSPNAEVKGHGPSQKVTVAGKCRTTNSALEPVGNYAVRITFADYLDKLDFEEKSRDP